MNKFRVCVLRFFSILVLFFLFVVSLQPANAETDYYRKYQYLVQKFDAGKLSKQEITFLQMSLSMNGFYNALADGEWGKLSQSALEEYIKERFDEEPNWVHVSIIIFDLLEALDKNEWIFQKAPNANFYFVRPNIKSMNVNQYSNLTEWSYQQLGLVIEAATFFGHQTRKMHSKLEDDLQNTASPYTVRKNRVWITSSETKDGNLHYALSRKKNAFKWNTVAVTGRENSKPYLNAVVASIRTSNTNPLILPQGVYLRTVLADAVRMFDEYAKSNGTTKNKSAIEKPKSASSSGTGFAINDEGYILTNHHVVDSCKSITIGNHIFEISAKSEKYDLALLKSYSFETRYFAEFSPKPARLNSDVTVLGYPLHGLLSGLNVTRGSVTSSRGLQGNINNFQLSAQVHSGNSGGPVLNKHANIIGVVVAKINAIKAAKAIGDIAQNINFAIRAEAAKTFLIAHDVKFNVGQEKTFYDNADIADFAKKYTFLILCN